MFKKHCLLNTVYTKKILSIQEMLWYIPVVYLFAPILTTSHSQSIHWISILTLGFLFSKKINFHEVMNLGMWWSHPLL